MNTRFNVNAGVHTDFIPTVINDDANFTNGLLQVSICYF